jgi:hypothetical protein
MTIWENLDTIITISFWKNNWKQQRISTISVKHKRKKTIFYGFSLICVLFLVHESIELLTMLWVLVDLLILRYIQITCCSVLDSYRVFFSLDVCLMRIAMSKSVRLGSLSDLLQLLPFLNLPLFKNHPRFHQPILNMHLVLQITPLNTPPWFDDTVAVAAGQ